MAVQIQMRRGTASQWQTSNPTLAAGEWGLETDTDKFKIGDGSTAWNSITNYSSLGVGTAGGTFAGTINFGTDGSGQDVNFYSGTSGDHMKWDASEEQLVITGTNGTVALNVADGNALFADDVTITGSLTVNGATTTLSTTNHVVEDSLIELNTGASSNANDLGIVMERGSTGDNAIIAWDESADKFTMGTTAATGASTGDLSITTGTLVANLEGNVTGTDATFTGTTTTYVDVVSETGAAHTFALSDAGKYIHCTGAAGNVTITLPSDSTTAFPVGTQMLFSCPHASNKITFAAGSSAAVTSLDDKLTLKGPDGVAAVLKWTTNSWLLFGPLE